MRKSIPLSEMACDLKIYLLQIVEQAIQFSRIYEKLVSKTDSEMDSIEYEKQVFKFTSFETGICKYPNLGHIRYCYLKLIGHNCNQQWLKLYFRSTELLLNRTESELKNSRSKQLDDSYMSDVPPNVPILHESLVGCAIKFIEQNQKAVMSKVTSLPLNKSKLKENVICSNIFIMKKEGQKIVSCRMGDMANPASDLYIVMVPSNISSHKKIAAYGKSFRGWWPVCLGKMKCPRGMEVEGLPDVDPASLLDENDRRYGDYAREHLIIEKLNPDDEYINSVMEGLIQEHIG